jgi:hypothetical protein
MAWLRSPAMVSEVVLEALSGTTLEVANEKRERKAQGEVDHSVNK